MSQRHQRQRISSHLSFLDVMACGLGAVLLILILIKFNGQPSNSGDEIHRLDNAIAQQQKANHQLNQKIAALTLQQQKVVSEQQAQITQQTRLQQQQKSAQQQFNQLLANVAQQEQAAIDHQQAQPDPITITGQAEEQYLLGLKVSGENIGILIDRSTSMTDYSLIGAIKKSLVSDEQRKNSAKWQRTQRIALWLITRLPPTSMVSIATFNDSATVLGTQLSYRAEAANATLLANAVKNLVPHQGSNLQAGLTQLTQAMPEMTDLYLVTDGLPTLGDYPQNLPSAVQCQSLLSKATTITGPCRLQLFHYTLQQFAPPGVRTNIILLPFEGDPQAASAYWQWAEATGGIVISPALTWP